MRPSYIMIYVHVYLQNALPDRRLFAKVWSRTKTPVNALILTIVVVSLFGLLSLASFIAVSSNLLDHGWWLTFGKINAIFR